MKDSTYQVALALALCPPEPVPTLTILQEDLSSTTTPRTEQGCLSASQHQGQGDQGRGRQSRLRVSDPAPPTRVVTRPSPRPQPLSSPTVGLRAQESSSLDKYPPPDMRLEAAPPRPWDPFPRPPPSPHPNPPWSLGRGQRPMCWPGGAGESSSGKAAAPGHPAWSTPGQRGPYASAGQLWPRGIAARAQRPGSQAARRRHLHPLLGLQPNVQESQGKRLGSNRLFSGFRGTGSPGESARGTLPEAEPSLSVSKDEEGPGRWGRQAQLPAAPRVGPRALGWAGL